ELDTANDLALYHDAFLARLTDPAWGIPLEISDAFCDCRSAAFQRRASYQCTYYLADRQGRFGLMQIRFRSVSVAANYRRELRQRFIAMGSDSAWLERILPSRPDEAQRRETNRAEALGGTR